ncbi:MAG: hypothetical protein ACREWJ_10795 [Rhodoferax sp.]
MSPFLKGVAKRLSLSLILLSALGGCAVYGPPPGTVVGTDANGQPIYAAPYSYYPGYTYYPYYYDSPYIGGGPFFFGFGYHHWGGWGAGHRGGHWGGHGGGGHWDGHGGGHHH